MKGLSVSSGLSSAYHKKVYCASIIFVRTPAEALPAPADIRTEIKHPAKKYKFSHNIEESGKIVYNEAYQRTEV